LIFQDIDAIFSGESGCTNGIVKCIENSRIPVILTSHQTFENSEVVKKCLKRGIKIKQVDRKMSDVYAMKVKIRFHAILIFEELLGKMASDHLDTLDSQDEGEINLSKIQWEALVTDQKLTEEYPYVTMFLKLVEFDLAKALGYLGVYGWQAILESLKQFERV
jgi:hypothetical protein